MKLKTILSAVAVVAAVSFVLLLVVIEIAYPMHLGEPSWYHIGRVNCGIAAVICAFVSIVSAIALPHF